MVRNLFGLQGVVSKPLLVENDQKLPNASIHLGPWAYSSNRKSSRRLLVIPHTSKQQVRTVKKKSRKKFLHTVKD